MGQPIAYVQQRWVKPKRMESVQGGWVGQKRPKSCVRTMYTAPNTEAPFKYVLISKYTLLKFQSKLLPFTAKEILSFGNIKWRKEPLALEAQ